MSNSKINNKFEEVKSNGNWTLPNVALALGSFMVFHPVGIAAVAWLAFGKDVNIARTLKEKYNQYGPSIKQKFNSDSYKTGSTPNNAYNKYHADQVAEYEAEIKRQSNAASSEANEFNEFVNKRQASKDAAEFTEFMETKNSDNK
ncbi:MAG: DUF2852 domain-containing protein [Rhizobiales bacterium]|nr:DUF2852 domain-containing protein [Hyphomicrobiales bacterium]